MKYAQKLDNRDIFANMITVLRESSRADSIRRPFRGQRRHPSTPPRPKEAQTSEDREKVVAKFEEALRVFDMVEYSEGIGAAANKGGILYAQEVGFGKLQEQARKARKCPRADQEAVASLESRRRKRKK